MNTYTGTFDNANWYQVFKNGQPFSHTRSYKYVKHSPDGFSFGYNGSGCAQLAFAILLEETNDPKLTQRLYQTFKSEVIAAFPQESSWTMTSNDVQRWLKNQS